MATISIKLEDQIGQAKEVLEAGDIDQAIAICRHIFRYYPRCLEVTRILGEAYTEKRLLDEAEKLLSFVLNADPQDVLGYVDQGFVFYERNQIDDAITYYERALELDPGIDQLRSELLRLYRERQPTSRAKLRLTKAGLANRRLHDGFYDQAIEEYSAILRETPERLDIQVGLLEAYWRSQDYARAESLALEMLDARPWLVKANLILWQIYGVRRRLEKSASFLEKVRMLDPLGSVAERLFEDPAASDNALSYISMLDVATIPPFEATETASQEDWLPEWVTSEASDNEASFATPGETEQEVSLADLGPDNDWLMRLIEESEQKAVQIQEQSKLDAQQEAAQSKLAAEQERAEALSNLDELRKHKAGSEDEFGGWLEDLSANAPQIDLNEARAVSPNADQAETVEVGAFDLELGQDHDDLFQLFDDLDTTDPMTSQSQATSAANKLNIDWDDLDLDVQPFDPEAVLVAKAADIEKEPEQSTEIASFSLSDETDAYFNQLEENAPMVAEPLEYATEAEQTIHQNEGHNMSDKQESQAAHQKEFAPFELDVALSSSEDDDKFVESLLGGDAVIAADEAAETEPDDSYARPVIHSTLKMPVTPHAFHHRDEQGPLPDFVASTDSTNVEAATTPLEQTNQTEATTKQGLTGTERSNKENEQMPIRKGGNEDNDLFDWEKEELPSYLAAFAMDEDEVANSGLASPKADITTTQTRIRPRDMDLTGENDIPEWLNPTNARPAGSGAARTNNMGDLGATAGTGLPNWLDAAELEDKQTSGGQKSGGPEAFDLGDMEPFSIEGFGGTNAPGGSLNQSRPQQAATPASKPPTQPFTPPSAPAQSNPFNIQGFDDDIQPFSLGDMAGNSGLGSTAQPSTPNRTPARPSTPPPSQPPANPAFNLGGLEDLDLGDLTPFNPGGDAAGPAAFTPPPAPQTQPKQPTSKQPFSPSPRPPAMPNRSNQPPVSAFDDLSDLQPFNFGGGGDESQQMGGGRASQSKPNAAFEPNFPQMPAMGGSGFEELSLDDIQPFSLEGFGESAEPPKPAPPPSRPGPTFNPPPSLSGLGGKTSANSNFELGNEDFGLPDELNGADLEPFSFGDIPGITSGPSKFNNMTLPDEPFMPSPIRRTREPEPQISAEPGQEAPLRSFSWVKNNKERDRDKARELEEEGGNSIFGKLAARRKQQMEELGVPELKPLRPGSGDEDEHDFPPESLLSFEEIEALSIKQDQPSTTVAANQPVQDDFALPATENVDKVNLELNNQLHRGLQDHTFEQGLDSTLQSSLELPDLSFEENFRGFDTPKTPSLDFEHDFVLEPFDLTEIAPDNPAMDFDLLAEQVSGKAATPEAETFDFKEFNLEELASDNFGASVSEAQNGSSLTQPTDEPSGWFSYNGLATEGASEPKEQKQPEVSAPFDFDFNQAVSAPAQVATPFELPEPPALPAFEATAPQVQPVAEAELPPVQIEATPPTLSQTTPTKNEAQLAQAVSEVTVPQPKAETVVAQPKVEMPSVQSPVAVVPQSVANPATPTVEATATNGAAKVNTLDSYLQQVKTNPRDTEANVQLAEAYYQQGQHNQAITYFGGAIKAADKPTLDKLANRLQNILGEANANPRFHRVLGDVYMKQGQYNMALNEYNQALGTAKAK